MRIVGLETEYALGFAPDRPGGAAPTQAAVFRAVARALKQRLPAVDALYYKGGEFLADGSLLHFEVARLDLPEVGLLEWATPECLGGIEAAIYSRAQEQSLRAALPEAEAELERGGFAGRVVILKNNADRAGNAYGCHESYDVGECGLPPPRWARAAHVTALAVAFAVLVAIGLPLVLVLLGLLALAAAASAVGLVPGLNRPARAVVEGVQSTIDFLVDAGRGRGSGLVARAALVALQVGAWLVTRTAPRVLFTGHLPAVLPFLATRSVVAGAGTITPDGRFELTPRAAVIRRSVAAFVAGPNRPMVDVKEHFYRRPLSWRAPRKRLHHLVGDANRSEYAEALKLATTEAVLDALEGGALDDLAARLVLDGGPVAALKATSADPTLRRQVARDRRTGERLTAVQVQRRYLEATWEFFRARGDIRPETKDALVRWSFVLDRLEDDPRTLDQELDWVIKLRLLATTLAAALPGRDESAAWATLAAWGPVNALLEQHAPAESLDDLGRGTRVAARVRTVLGWWAFRRAARTVARAKLDWAELPAVRAAWLRLKALDLRYHELSREGGPFDRLAEAGRIARIVDPQRVARARVEPPARTRAAIRGAWIRRGNVRVGWDRVVIQGADGEPRRTVPLDDPYAHDAVAFELEAPEHRIEGEDVAGEDSDAASRDPNAKSDEPS